MNSVIKVAIFLVAPAFASCRSNDKVESDGGFSKSVLDGSESVSEPKVIDELMSSSEDSPGSITQGTSEAQTDNAGKIVKKTYGITTKSRVMSTGDEYLIGIDNGSWRHEIPNLSPKDVAGMNLSLIRDETIQKESPKIGISVKDSKTAYARVLDLNVSLIGEIVCQGIYTSDDEKGFFVFYGVQGKPLDQYMLAYHVRKSDGLITLYRKGFKIDRSGVGP